MTGLDVSSVAALLREFAQRSALQGDNPFRTKAYARAADNLLTLTLPLDQVIAEERLQDIPGVGEAIADIVKKLHATGSHPALEKMRKEIPTDVLEMLTVPGLRPDKVLKLYRELGLSSLAELEEAVRGDRLRKIKGLGASLQSKILRGIEMRRAAQGRRHMHRAAELLKVAEKHLREARPDIVRISAAGDFRRGCELVGDLSLVAEVRHLPDSAQALSMGVELTARLTDAAHFGVTLLLATGSEAHLAGLRAIAASQSMSLDDDGLRRDGKLVAAASEDSIYRALGMQPVPPELREGRNEIAQALAGNLPELVTDHDIAGMLHAHTDRSDGLDTLETMAEAALSRGYEYFGVSEHSRSAHYAGGLSQQEIAEQQAEADSLNRRSGERFRIFKGVESDILADGSLDYPNEVLETFDFVVASVHGRFNMDRASQTERIICAVSNPYTTILGHMTGRQLLRRPGYEIDTEKVLAACAEHGVAVEINANPWRLDLDWRWHDIALKLGCLMSINPDAHSTRELDLTHWGVEMARKGGVPKERVLNCLSKDELAFYLEKRRDRRVKLVSLQDGKPRLSTSTSGVKKPAAPRKRLKATNH